ncbi:uncharacterized protein LOC124137753 [Haliotis rufescens]|uniref:uncharacterized protein LOC124137753 n=1 Tax=Haliotis rufescens TaxID=6454 RepID=UPI00201EEAB9|nr:uncharacterized protein LOC124137753 [Haliotis rufescens]
MADILTMIDIIYPKLRMFTDGARTAALIMYRLKYGKKQPQHDYMVDPEEDNSHWGPGGDDSWQTWGPGEDNFHWGQWEDILEDERDTRFDNSYTSKPQTNWYSNLDAESETNVKIPDDAIIPIGYEVMAGDVRTARRKSGKKSLRSRIVSVMRRLSFCIPRKTTL